MKLFILFIFLLSSSLFAGKSEISLQLQWKHQFQFAGFYVAKEKGYYDDVGLKVNIKEFESSTKTVDEVISKKATYAVGRSSLIIESARGKQIVALGSIYQRSPTVLITTNPSIKNIHDLKNKKVMITPDAIASASIIGMLASNGIGENDITIQKHSFNYNDLINGTTDAMACYISNEPYYLEKIGVKYNSFYPSDYGFDFYSDIVFTSKNEVKNNPKRVDGFRKASKKGWLWAFNNIEETAKLIYEKYNTQNKTLDSLIYEGYKLKKLALVDGIPFGSISKKKLESIAKVFQLKGMINGSFNINDFLYPVKEEVKIGVLSKRGTEATYKRWNSLASYLNNKLYYYSFKIVPLDFEQLKHSVKSKSVDFVITNTMYYVLLESMYGISRIATLINSDREGKYRLTKFGGVIFTRSDNNSVNYISDLENKSFGAVSELSFGGWIMAYEELVHHNIGLEDIKVDFLGTHDLVVKAVLDGKVAAGTVRTDTLERMSNEGKINLSDIKVIEPKRYQSFPYLVSTNLYPEWPIAKVIHTSDNLANELLAELVMYTPSKESVKINNILGWTVPLDYTSVHNVLKGLRLAPYENIEVRFEDIIAEYALVLYFVVLVIILLIVRLFYEHKYSKKLDKSVKEKTQELLLVNKKLKVLANQDFLTGISNRAHFMKFAKKYFEVAHRNNEELQLLSLDLDYFKDINDTYGHQAGDCVLKAFTNRILLLLRKSDLFGRVGGEEFCILLQNTSLEGGEKFAKRICEATEQMDIECDEKIINITVSIGIASLSDEVSIDELIKKSDIALYMSKDNGRNQATIYSEN